MKDSRQRRRAPRGTRHIFKHVNKSGSVSYYARFTDADGQRRHVTLGKSYEEARRNFAQLQARVHSGKLAIEPRREEANLTVEDLARKFKEEVVLPVRDLKLYRREMWSILRRHALPDLGKLRAEAVTRKSVVAMRDRLLSEDVHPRSVQKAIAAVSKLFNWAIEQELVASNPARGVKKPRTQSATHFYSEDEVARMLVWAAEHAPELHPVIAFAFYTGARKGEIAAVRWGDVDLDAGRVTLRRSWKQPARKSGEPVVVMVHPHLGAILRALKADDERGDDALVFPAANGLMRDKFDLWGLDDVLAGAKVRRFTNPWHAFRHSHATTLAARGANLIEIRDALGQKTLHMAAVYTHIASEQLRKRIDSLPTLGPAPAVASLDEQRKRAKSGARRA